MHPPKFWLIVAGLLGAAGVALGAYGAHGLEKNVRGIVDRAAQAEEVPPSPVEREQSVARRMANWDTAVRYHLTHVAALAVVALAAARWPMRRWTVAGVALLVGIAMFSGLLYVQALSTIPGMGFGVMLGGIALMMGWLSLAVAAIGIR